MNIQPHFVMENDKRERLMDLEVRLADEHGSLLHGVGCGKTGCYNFGDVRSEVIERVWQHTPGSIWLCLECWKENGEKHRGEP